MSWNEEVPADVVLVKNPGIERPELITALSRLERILSQKPKSIVAELNTYRRYVPLILEAYLKMSEALNKSILQIDRCTDIEYDRANRRWSREEDEEIIDRVCEGKLNIHQLSTIFGRSPGAIQTHISELVGRERLSQAVAGRFVGMIDGISAEAEICGKVFK